MAHFLLDIGNSRLKWAMTSGNGKLASVGCANHPSRGVDQFASQHWAAFEPPEMVMISCVASLKFVEQITNWIESNWGVTPQLVVSPSQGWGVTNAYVDPSKLGCDRWAALVAGRARTSRPCFIVDCGTAVTVDVLAADGVHQGGLIVPGLALMRESLVKRTARIRPQGNPNANRGTSLFARDTAGAVEGGTLYALVSFIDRAAQDVETEMGEKIHRFLTGGDAPAVLPLLAGPYDHVPELVLEGLAVMAGGP